MFSREGDRGKYLTGKYLLICIAPEIFYIEEGIHTSPPRLHPRQLATVER